MPVWFHYAYHKMHVNYLDACVVYTRAYIALPLNAASEGILAMRTLS
jgi:hypothetical protein